MSKYDLTTLNEEQLKALYETEGPVLVNAGAGSGKTRLLTHRIVYLVQEKGVSPYNILAITFTNKAANEMKERIESMCGLCSNIWISTFHAMCAKILRKDIGKLDGYTSNFSIFSDTDTDKIFKKLFEVHKVEDDKLKKKITGAVAYIKNYNLKPEEYLAEFDFDSDSKMIVDIFMEYQRELKQNNALDFDDLLIKTYELLKTNAEAREYYQNKFKYVLVDEFQDTNKIQFELVSLLSAKYKNIFVVGDEDQCIYTWRGALNTNINDFKKVFQGTKVFKLERNYRSTKSILNIANKVIANNTQRMGKVLYTENMEGETVEYNECSDEKEEAYFVARKIYQLVKYEGYKYSDFAILMRLNALTLPFEECLLSYNISYKIYGGFKFFERVEVKNLIAYLRMFANPQDEISLARIINFPKRNIGQVAVDTIKDYAERNRVSMLEIIENMNDYALPQALKNKLEKFREVFIELKEEQEKVSISQFVEDLIKKFNIKSAYSTDSEEDLNKCANIDMFLTSVIEFEEKNEGATLTEYLEKISLISDIDGMNEESNNVTVATIHSMKGLEFRVVFVIGAEEKIFPISRAFDSNKDMEEERRLMYVAITRAEEKLFITSARTRFMYGKRDYMTKSRFLTEAGLVVKRDLYSQEPRTYQSSYTSQPFSDNYSCVSNKKTDYSYSPQKASVFANKTAYSSYMEEKTEKINTSIYSVGNNVLHPKFGIGKILSFSSDRKCADIDFKGIGVKTLMLEIAPLKILGGNENE